jgi:putative radical SAM enzyme (TIGR03279 family)
MSAPRVVSVAPASPADRVGLLPGDEILALNGEVPRDVIAYRLLTDEPDVVLDVSRGGLELQFQVEKEAGEPLGAEVSSALFDQVRTCDNHCEFCFIYQLPPGMRKSLYLKDDDYRLSFLYGNFTTLTRFTEADLERVVTERISPLHVSIHATDPEVRADLLRNRRGATSLRWLRALLDHDIEVHGQIVVCPGRNDGAVLDDTLAGVLDRFPELASLCIVPLGVSRYNTEAAMRPHTQEEAAAVVAAVHDWQDVYLATLGHRLVFAADEYYLLAGEPFPEPEAYEGFPMHEDGVGMARTFELEFTGAVSQATGVATGFFAWVDGAPPEGYRAPRTSPTSLAVAGTCGSTEPGGATSVSLKPRRTAPIAILTGSYGASVLGPLVAGLERDDVRVIAVENQFFGGNTGVAGLLNGPDLTRVLADEPPGHRYLLPDVCLSQGRFLDGTTPEELPRPVEVVATDGIALRAALEDR